MMAQTAGGGSVELDQATLDGFRTRLRGSLVLPGEAGYEGRSPVGGSIRRQRTAPARTCRW